MIDFITSVIGGIGSAVWSTVSNIVQNAEAVVILSAAAVGTTFMLAELPFQIALPLGLEAIISTQFILPVISVLIIIALCLLMKWRMNIES